MALQLINCGPSPHGWHPLGQVLTCPALYGLARLYQQEGIAGEVALPLIKGTLLHTLLAHHYIGSELYYKPVDAFLQVAKLEKFDNEILMGELLRCFDSYRLRYPIETFKMLHVEHLFEAQVSGWPYTARIDLVIEDKAGKVWFIDHKTTSKLGTSAHEPYLMDGQIVGQHYLGRVHYQERFGGVGLNMIQLRAPFMFRRFWDTCSPGHLNRFEREVDRANRWIEKLKGMKPEDYPRVMSQQVCVNKYAKCTYFDICRWNRFPK